jgi:predicted dehydrogenase
VTRIALGLIGAGLIGRKHISRISTHPDFDLVGIADVNVDAVRAQNPGLPVSADYRKMLDEARPQAVVIASPNQLHAEQGIECARRGIHILIEKPVTDTLANAAGLIAEVKKAGIQSLVGHHRRHHRQVRTLQSLLRDGRIGELVGVSGLWATYKPDDYFAVAPWRRQPGGGPVLINLIHEIDFLRLVVGEIVAVSAIASNRRRGFAVEDSAGALLEFETGAIGSFLLSDSAVSPWTTERGLGESPEFPFSGESNYRFVGSHGALEFPELVHWTQAAGAQNWNLPISAQRIHAPTIDPYVAQLDHFRDVIRGISPSLQPVEDGARTLLATLAVSEAAASGQRIDLRGRYQELAFDPVLQASQRKEF